MSNCLVKFERAHLAAIENASEELGSAKVMDELEGASAMTVLVDDVPVACGGIYVMWPGAAEAWCRVGAQARKCKALVVNCSIALLENISRANGIHRLQCKVAAENMVGHRFALYLGFMPEVVLRWFGPNKEDYVQYVRFYD